MHYKKEELTSGYCICCEMQVTDLIKGKKICTGCEEVAKPGENLTDEDGEDQDTDY